MFHCLFLLVALVTAQQCGPTMCPALYRPVCGSDGKTYGNACELGAASRCDSSIVWVHDGECCNHACNKDFRPVCGTDGVTYGNRCMFEAAQCENNTIELAHEGPCECPDGPVVACLVNPCDTAECPIYPSAECHTLPCEPCSYEFRTKTGKVIRDCSLPPVRCNRRPVNCLVSPCRETCAAYPNATCQERYCTGCDADWWWEGAKVSCVVGCNSGYWRRTSSDHWPIRNLRFSAVFNVPYTAFLSSALRSNNELAAQAVAALLNAESNIGFKYSPSEVKEKVHDAWNVKRAEKALLEDLKKENNGKCPL